MKTFDCEKGLEKSFTIETSNAMYFNTKTDEGSPYCQQVKY